MDTCPSKHYFTIVSSLSFIHPSIYSRVSCRNIENIEEGIGLGLCQAIKGLSVIMAGIIIAFVQSWQLSLLCSIILPAVLLTVVVSSKVR